LIFKGAKSMSHFVNITTQIKDSKALIKALGRLGFNNVEYHEKPANLYGYQNDLRKEMANVIIRRKYVGTSSNDIGFEKNSNGLFIAHISEFDQGTGTYSNHKGKYGEEWQNKLYTWYGVEKAKMEFDKYGQTYCEDTDDQGRPRLKVRI